MNLKVKMEKVGKNAKATLTVDIQAGKLFAVKPSKEVLDDSNTFTHEKGMFVSLNIHFSFAIVNNSTCVL